MVKDGEKIKSNGAGLGSSKRMKVNIVLNGEKGTVMSDFFEPNVFHNNCLNYRYIVQNTYFDELAGLIDKFVSDKTKMIIRRDY